MPQIAPGACWVLPERAGSGKRFPTPAARACAFFVGSSVWRIMEHWFFVPPRGKNASGPHPKRWVRLVGTRLWRPGSVSVLMRGFIPTTNSAHGRAPVRGTASACVSAAGFVVLLILTTLPGGCRTSLRTQHARNDTQTPHAYDGESPHRVDPVASPTDDYLSTEVGEMMREDQQRSGSGLNAHPTRPPPRQPGDTPLRPAQRPGMQRNGP